MKQQSIVVTGCRSRSDEREETILGRSQCIETFSSRYPHGEKSGHGVRFIALGTAFVPPVGVPLLFKMIMAASRSCFGRPAPRSGFHAVSPGESCALTSICVQAFSADNVNFKFSTCFFGFSFDDHHIIFII